MKKPSPEYVWDSWDSAWESAKIWGSPKSEAEAVGAGRGGPTCTGREPHEVPWCGLQVRHLSLFSTWTLLDQTVLHLRFPTPPHMLAFVTPLQQTTPASKVLFQAQLVQVCIVVSATSQNPHSPIPAPHTRTLFIFHKNMPSPNLVFQKKCNICYLSVLLQCMVNVFSAIMSTNMQYNNNTIRISCPEHFAVWDALYICVCLYILACVFVCVCVFTTTCETGIIIASSQRKTLRIREIYCPEFLQQITACACRNHTEPGAAPIF